MSELLAYLAGVMDSDGHLTLVRKNRKRRDESAVAYYQPTVGCAQIQALIPDLLAETFGGRVYPLAPSGNHRATFQWQSYSTVAYRAAEALLPYLRLKRRQAEILLAYEGTNVMRSAGGARITPEQAAARAELYAEIRVLNVGSRRGQVTPEIVRREILGRLTPA